MGIADPAAARAITYHVQAGARQACIQRRQGILQRVRTCEGLRFMAIASPQVQAWQQSVQQVGGDVVEQRAGIEADVNIPRQGQQPAQQGLRFARLQQAVTADIHVVVMGHLHLLQIIGAQHALGADVRDERAFCAGFRQGHTQAGVCVRIGWQGRGDAFVAHGLTRQFTEPALAVSPQVQGGQAVTPGGGHHVKTAPGVEAGAAGQRITARGWQGIECHHQVDDDLACVQQPRHGQAPCH